MTWYEIFIFTVALAVGFAAIIGALFFVTLLVWEYFFRDEP